MADALASLAGLLPPGAVTTDPDALATASHDAWALSLLRRARGDAPVLPAAVAFAASTEDVRAVLRWATGHRTPVVPRGGGSGVSGGALAPAGSVVLDLSRMDAVLAVDAESGTVSAQAGIRGDRLEEHLRAEGLTTGHYPQSLAISTVGGWVAASSAGQGSAGYGAIEDLVRGLTAVLADGRVLRLRATPRSAAGPDLRRLLIGSEGTLGVVTEAVLTCVRAPEALVWDCFAFGDPRAMFGALRTVARSEAGPIFVRGYDEPDARFAFASRGDPGSCVAIVGFDRDVPGLRERRRAVAEAASAGRRADEAFGEHWYEHRNDAVATYRRIMGPDRMFGTGTVVDTLEVAALWRDVPALYDAVLAALARHAELVGCHVSHVYPSGSSLYFTFLLRGADDTDVEPRYLAAWDDAMRACLGAGGTITHHHGVGRLKARYLEAELGAEGVEVLRAVKRALDPLGILNPGALLA